MKNILKLSVIAALVALLGGCGEDLKPKVAALEAELAKEKAAFSVIAAKVALSEKIEADKKAEAAMKATISVQVAVTMQSGDAKPVANTKIYLTTRPLKQIFAGIKDDKGRTPRWGYVTYAGGKYGGENANMAADMEKAVESSSVMQDITDLAGSAVLENAPLGTYYLVCASSIGQLGSHFEKRVTVKSGMVKVRLTNDDIADEDN